LQAVGAGASQREAADRFGVSAASVSRWREREQGAPRPIALGGDRRSRVMASQAVAILAIVAANRDLTLAEIKSALAEQKVEASLAELWRFFRRHGITLRKSRRTPQRAGSP
jgi:transposase